MKKKKKKQKKTKKKSKKIFQQKTTRKRRAGSKQIFYGDDPAVVRGSEVIQEFLVAEEWREEALAEVEEEDVAGLFKALDDLVDVLPWIYLTKSSMLTGDPC